MLFGCSLIRSSGLWRAVYMICLLVSLSYILFNVLDLDGSNFPRLLTPVERSIIVAEVTEPVVFGASPETAPARADHTHLSKDRSRESNRLRRLKTLGFAALDWTRYHGYRLGSPRNSAAAASPDH